MGRAEAELEAEGQEESTGSELTWVMETGRKRKIRAILRV